jgi:DNA end-binding protein Ku
MLAALVVGALDRGLAMYVLRFPDELRSAQRYFGDLPATSDRPDMVELAVKLLEQNASPFKPEVYKNSYQEALLALIKEKSKGTKIKAPEPEHARPSARHRSG